MSRIDELLAAMTLDEKIGQLVMLAAGFSVTGPVLAKDVDSQVRGGRAGNLLNVFGRDVTGRLQRIALEESRLKIPLLFGFDVVHGHRTIFPIPVAEASSFDPALWERTARIAAIEAAADGLALTFAPMVDVARDPRWGRIAEGAGEDPLVASLMAQAKIRGFEGEDIGARDAVAATAKHFVAYGAAVAGRDYASTDVSERTLREVYLPPFAAASKAGVSAMMPAFSDLSGVPMTANGALIDGWFRGEAGFNGVVISDYNAIAELVTQGVAADLSEAAALALNAGVDIDMMSNAYAKGLPTALDRGLVALETVDAAVRRVLRLKERLGLFAEPFRRGADLSASRGARRDAAREAVRRSVVLLTNHDGVLPLADRPMRIAVVGPLADAATDMMGSWSGAGKTSETVTILDGLRAARPDCTFTHARGVGIVDADADGFEPALKAVREAEIAILCIGESRDMSGEAASRAGLDLPGDQMNFVQAVLALGKPTIVLLSSGRPIATPWLFERASAVLATWFGGSEAGNGIADVLTGRASPSGRLPVTWPRSVGQVPIFFAQRPTGRPPSDAHYTSKYLDLPTTPLFPFGHGLTYGDFIYGSLEATPKAAITSDTLVVEVEVENRGEREAEETIFLFVRKPVALVSRPLLELKGFTKLALRPGEKGRAAMLLPVAALSFPGPDLKPWVEPGDYEILAGPAADRGRLLTARVTIASA